MYAIIETGGKQYRVEPGALIQVSSLPGEVGAAVNCRRCGSSMGTKDSPSGNRWWRAPWSRQRLLARVALAPSRCSKRNGGRTIAEPRDTARDLPRLELRASRHTSRTTGVSHGNK